MYVDIVISNIFYLNKHFFFEQSSRFIQISYLWLSSFSFLKWLNNRKISVGTSKPTPVTHSLVGNEFSTCLITENTGLFNRCRHETNASFGANCQKALSKVKV